MEYQTVNSREIVIPELAVTLHIHAVELPGSMSEAAEGRHSEELDALLVAVCQEVFRVGPNEIISFSEWSRAGKTVLTALGSFESAHRSDRSFVAAQRSVAAAVKEFEGPGDYLERLMTNGLLVPRQRVKNSGLLWLEEASTHDRIAPELFGNLATGGVSELGFSNWYHISQLAYPQEYPSAAEARKEIPSFEVPVAGSKPIKSITIENFQRLCYGAAALVMTETGLAATSAIGRGDAPVLAAVLGGSVTALIFVSVGSLSRFLEEYLKSKSKLSQAPNTTNKRIRRAAA